MSVRRLAQVSNYGVRSGATRQRLCCCVNDVDHSAALAVRVFRDGHEARDLICLNLVGWELKGPSPRWWSISAAAALQPGRGGAMGGYATGWAVAWGQ